MLVLVVCRSEPWHHGRRSTTRCKALKGLAHGAFSIFSDLHCSQTAQQHQFRHHSWSLLLHIILARKCVLCSSHGAFEQKLALSRVTLWVLFGSSCDVVATLRVVVAAARTHVVEAGGLCLHLTFVIHRDASLCEEVIKDGFAASKGLL